MKKLNLLLFMAISSLFISCDKDEDNEVIIDENQITGEWQMSAYEISNANIKLDILGETLTAAYSVVGKDFDYTVVISEEPNSIIGNGSFTATVSTSIAGETTTEEDRISEGLAGGTWRIEDNKLFVTTLVEEEEEEVFYTIKTLTENTLIIEQAYNEIIEDPIFETTTEVNGTLNITLEK